MARHLLYFIGEPGIGKSTLVAELTAGLTGYAATRPFRHMVWEGEGEERPLVAELGPRREGGFSGTDGLSMSVQPRVIEWLSQHHYDLVLGEGDRLANDKFFTAASAAGYEVAVIHVAAPPEVAAARRAERAQRLASKGQNETWLRGRITKSTRLAEKWAEATLDANLHPGALVACLAEQPVVAALRGD